MALNQFRNYKVNNHSILLDLAKTWATITKVAHLKIESDIFLG